MRGVFTLIHRWIGLAVAAFLFVAGLTGAVISWDHELDDFLNSHLTMAASNGPPISALDLARQVEARDQRAWVTCIPLAVEPGDSLRLCVSPRVDAQTRQVYDLEYNEVFLDPVTGVELGKREWGAVWPITAETFVSFLYKLHYSLHIPEIWGGDEWGVWLMGIISLIWAMDCFIGFYLTLPMHRGASSGRTNSVADNADRGWWARWKPAWKIKANGSAYRINFDIHRAFGLWTWIFLFILAFTGFSLNLYREIFLPVISTISQVTPTPHALRGATPTKHDLIEPAIGFADIIEKARRDALARGWDAPPGIIFYSPRYGIYGINFYNPGDNHGAAGVGPPRLMYDGQDGRYLGDRQPWVGTAADIFLQAQFPLHSGRILGLPGRILVSAMGIIVAALSVTGVVIWYRKHMARMRRQNVYRIDTIHNRFSS